MKMKNKIITMVLLMILITSTVSAAEEEGGFFSDMFSWIKGLFSSKESISYEYIYENISKEVPIYEEVLVKEDRIYYSNNNSWRPAKNYTQKRFKEYNVKYEKGEIIGVIINGKEYYGNVYVKGNILSRWDVPIGDRNLDEFGECREYEEEKGVCERIDISNG